MNSLGVNTEQFSCFFEMHFLVATLTVVFLAAVSLVGGCGEGRQSPVSEHDPRFHSQPKITYCITPKTCDTVRCRSIKPAHCPSGRVVKCGCCNVCAVIVGLREKCRYDALTNVICEPGLICGERNVCVRKRPHTHPPRSYPPVPPFHSSEHQLKHPADVPNPEWNIWD